MYSKVVKVKNSVFISVTKAQLTELGLQMGDRVELNRPGKKMLEVIPSQHEDMARTIQFSAEFIEKYRPALEALAKK